jgi:hypothetical protein
MPHIFIGSFKRAEPYANTKQSLSAPGITRSYVHCTHILGFATVHGHLQFFVYAVLE